MLHFAQPLWLIAGIIVCLAATLFIRINIVRRKKELQQFVSQHLLASLTRNVSLSRRRLKNILLVLGLACLFIGLARPQYGNRWVEVKRKGIDILIGVDVSKSMLARDISPNRLERAKLAIRDFVTKLEGDRVGLLPFAGTAFLMCPLTTDYDAFNASLDALDVNTIPKGGTDIGTAIREASKVLANEANHKIFVLVTDGEDDEDLENASIEAAMEAKMLDMAIYTIAVGTHKGELIPIPGGEPGRFVQDESGTFITSKLDEKALIKIAETTNGLYAPLGNMGQGFDAIYQQKLSLIPKEEHDQRKRKVPIERFPWPLGAAVLLLGSDFLITGRKSVWALRLPFIKTAGRRKKQQAVILALVLISATWSSPVRASEGEELFKAGEYDQATSFYEERLKKNPENPVLHFNLGDSLYRENKYEQAIAEFDKSLKTEDLSLQAKSYFNRGNAQYLLGTETLMTDPEHTDDLWQQAQESYKSSNTLQPKDKEASKNLELVKKKHKQLKELLQKREKEKKKGNSEQQENKQDKEDGQEQGNQGKKDDKKNKDQEQQKNGKQSSKDNAEQNEQQKPEQNTNGNKNDQGKNEKQQEQKNGDTDDEQQQSAGDKSGQQAKEINRKDMERRLQGKMTKEEAKNLLNSLKGEQGELNFIPQGTGTPDDETRDW